MFSRRGVYLIVTLLVGSSLSAAGPVGIGETVDLQGGIVPPDGVLVAHDSRPFTLTFPDVENVYDYRLDNDVYRDPSSGKLTFAYSVVLTEPNTGSINRGFNEGPRLSVRSFAGFATDVSGIASNSVDFVRRSTDGAELFLSTRSSGQGLAPTLVVRTDALGFNSEGAISLTGSDEFPTLPSNTIDIRQASASISGTFQPSAVAVPIPLPPGAWAGLATFALSGAIAGARRVWRR